MPFMQGAAPIRRTMSYLEAGRLIFHDQIKVVTINYNIDQKSSEGAYKFVFWHLPQLKYKNPRLQLLKFKNMTPTPCIQLFCDNGKRHVVDVYGRSREDIHNHLLTAFCKSSGDLRDKKMSMGSFGYHSKNWCMCEVPGQVPCPGFALLPENMRGKHVIKKYQEEMEAKENS